MKVKNEIRITQKLFFDFEVTPNWWCVVFRDYRTGKELVVSSDNDYSTLRTIKRNTLLIGFNIKMYDLQILSAIVKGATPQQVFKISNTIINENGKKNLSDEGREYYHKYSFQDLKDDFGVVGSLKKFESNFGYMVKECPVPFTTPNMTKEQKAEMIEYCKHDVFATAMMWKNREDYLKSKKIIARMCNIPLDQAYKQSHPKLACTILECREMQPIINEPLKSPPHLRNYCVKHLGERIVERVMNLRPSGELFKAESFTEIWFENNVMFGDGGLHSVLDTDIHLKTNDKYLLVDIDVTSYYPSLMTKGKLLTRATTNADRFQDLLNTRLEFKKLKKAKDPRYNGEFDTALKLLINGLYGAMGNKNMTAYDPCMRSSICRVGQLMLVALCQRIYKECGAKILKTNTDGILVYIERTKLDDMKAIVKDWENESGFEMDYKYLDEIWQKNVSNYIQVINRAENKLCLRGSWVGQAYPNNERRNPLHAPICQRAVVEFLVHGTPIEQTIMNCDSLLEFCYTISKGRTFDEMYQEIYTDEGIETNELQKVSRIIACKDITHGEIIKHNDEFTRRIDDFEYTDERNVRVSGIPLFPKIVDEDLSTISDFKNDLHYEWYIELAKELLKVKWKEVI